MSREEVIIRTDDKVIVYERIGQRSNDKEIIRRSEVK